MSSREMSKELTEKYFELLTIMQFENEHELMVKELKKLIRKTRASMTKEEIAWVEQQFN